MKYIVLIIDGAAGHPLSDYGGKTSLEIARTPNLDIMAANGRLGLARTVPEGMEPSSACACMSVIGYDPVIYYKGRAAIEAKNLGIDINDGEVLFRCNLVTIENGIMKDYSAGHITTAGAVEIVQTLNDKLGGEDVIFYPGTGYRQYVKLIGRPETLKAVCIGPHDIPDMKIEEYLPHGEGSKFIRNLMRRSEPVLRHHPVNIKRIEQGKNPATTIWLFWGCGQVPDMPPYREVYGINAAMTSGVDLLKGLARMAGMDILEISGVTDGPDNDYRSQAVGALNALQNHDMVIIHVEAPDELGHSGDARAKVEAIEMIDREIAGRILNYPGEVRVLVMPDHPTPVDLRTHTGEPVPFLMWGKGIPPGGSLRFTEKEAAATGNVYEQGYKIMRELTGGN